MLSPTHSGQPALAGQTALVTGGGRGIGRAIALALGRHGARVVLTARTGTELESAAAEIRAAGGRADVCTADLSNESQIAALFAFIRDEAGTLDILINNAGRFIAGRIDEQPVSALDEILSANVRAPFLCCQHALALMRPRRKGYIINIASVTGFRGYPSQGAYSASKHALMGLTKALAREVHAEGIRVSAIQPGGVDTTMIGDARPDLRRDDLMHPDDVAQAVLYLLSLSPRAAVDEIYLRRASSTPF